MKLFKKNYSKEKKLLDREQISKMNANEIARFIRTTPNSWIIRAEDGSIDKIVEKKRLPSRKR